MVKNNRIWRSEIAKSLLASTGAKTVEEAIPQLVDAKLSMFGPLNPPIDLRMVASGFRISSHFNYIQMSESARLRPEGDDKYVIDVNVNHNEARQRFSIAHEIGHKALLDRGIRITKHRGSASYTFEQREEEEICDAIATILLGLRPEYVHARLNEYGYTFKTVEHISSECSTSFEATLRAILRYSECAAAGVYCAMHGGLVAGIADRFMIRRVYHSPYFAPPFSTDYILSGVMCLREAMRQNGKVIATDETFAINNMVYTLHAEAKRMMIYVDEQTSVGVVMLVSE